MTLEGGFVVVDWGAWIPGVFTKQEWKEYFSSGTTSPQRTDPVCSLLTALMRRRMTRMSRILAAVAMEGCRRAKIDMGKIPMVFASRHGELDTLTGLLGSLSRQEPMSPTAFSHSVHHTSGSHLGIAFGNRLGLRAVSGGESTFFYGLVDAVGVLRDGPSDHVLYVLTDEGVPDVFHGRVRGPTSPYALGILLSSDPKRGQTVTVNMSLSRVERAPTPCSEHYGVGFLRWLKDATVPWRPCVEGREWTFSKKNKMTIDETKA